MTWTTAFFAAIGGAVLMLGLLVMLGLCFAASHRDDRKYRPEPELFDLPVPRSALCSCFVVGGLEYTERDCPLHGDRSWHG